MPKISCVMPTRNRDDLIGETIQSIIHQTMTDWELIVVDDHSEKGDRTEEVIKSFNDPRIKYFKLNDISGIGIACARNFGSVMASADYIAVMDSDDLCYDYRFELTLEKFAKINPDILYGDFDIWIPETGEIKKRVGDYAPRDFDIDYIKKFNYIPHGTVTYKREIAYNFPYNSFFEIAEDYELYLRLISQGKKFVYINRPLIKRRVHQGSITKRKKFAFNYAEVARDLHKQ